MTDNITNCRAVAKGWRKLIRAVLVLGIREHAPMKDLKILLDLYSELGGCVNGKGTNVPANFNGYGSLK